MPENTDDSPLEMTPMEFHKRFPHAEVNHDCAIDYACPKCGSRGPFRVEVCTFVELSDEGGFSTPEDLEETGAPNTECLECGYEGGDFQIEGLDEYLAGA